MIRNPKMEGTNTWDCRPQVGRCVLDCNQCFYNRPGAFYSDINEPYIPDPKEVGDGIVRCNCGGDSNIQKNLVIETAQKYKNYFFNTSIPHLDFPGPVVFTANSSEETPAWAPHTIRTSKVMEMPSDQEKFYDNLMFVRLRVSPTNLELVSDAIVEWTCQGIPVVLTFMAYYDQNPPGTHRIEDKCFWFLPESESDDQKYKHMKKIAAYTWRVRHINSYFCPTKEFMLWVLRRMKIIGGKLCTMCGTPDSYYCRDCMNCSTYYTQTMKHLAEKPAPQV